MTEKPNAIILAGGASTRLGEDKALIPLRGIPLMTRVAWRLSDLAGRIIIAGRSHLPADIGLSTNVTFVPDTTYGEGPLVGIYSGLLASNAHHNIVVGCDMPFVSRRLLALLLDRAASSDTAGVVPEFAADPQPLCAVYDRDCLDEMRRAIGEGGRSPRDFLKRLSITVVPAQDFSDIDPTGRSFFNINTKDDLRKAEEMLRGF